MSIRRASPIAAMAAIASMALATDTTDLEENPEVFLIRCPQKSDDNDFAVSGPDRTGHRGNGGKKQRRKW